MKTLKAPRIKEVASELGLPLHQIDTFTGWTPPETDLIIAVSFGLLIPARIIKSNRYGGLNVHPSLLPDLRGPAPVPWAVFHGRTQTGVTVQTLHQTRFDHGLIVYQSAKVDIANQNLFEIFGRLTSVSVKALLHVLQHRLYESPNQFSAVREEENITHAPKVKTEDRLIDFQTMPAVEIRRRGMAFGRPFAFIDVKGRKRQVSFSVADRQWTGTTGAELETPVGIPFARRQVGYDPLRCDGHILVRTIDGCVLVIKVMTISGQKQAPAMQAAARAHLFEEPETVGEKAIWRFKAPLTST